MSYDWKDFGTKQKDYEKSKRYLEIFVGKDICHVDLETIDGVQEHPKGFSEG